MTIDWNAHDSLDPPIAIAPVAAADERGVMNVPALSLPHLWHYMAHPSARCRRIIERLGGEPEKLAAVRNEMLELAEPYFSNNFMHQDYLLTRAAAH